MKKKNISSKDLNTWFKFVKNLPNIEDKEKGQKVLSTPTKKTLDLHGFSLNDANKVVHEKLEDCFSKGIKTLKIITGKGSRSKSFNDPYQSHEFSILKNSIPEYIQNSDLKKYVIRITEADPSDGGQGAIYVFLKNKFR